LKFQANAHHISPDGYVREAPERDLASSLEVQPRGIPFQTGRGMFAKYGPAPSAEEIDTNRADMHSSGRIRIVAFYPFADTLQIVRG
jgi:hypothetical protein